MRWGWAKPALRWLPSLSRIEMHWRPIAPQACASFYLKPRLDDTQDYAGEVRSILVSIDASTGLIVQTTFGMISTDNTPYQQYNIGDYAIHPLYIFLLLPHHLNI